jgi:hypothetical protein
MLGSRMQLALFTPGAFIWPVHRNFEAFVVSLGAPALDAADIDSAPCYPARIRTDSAVHALPPRLDERLTLLHRELYDALLRPAEYFAAEQRSFADVFWPDLRSTAVDALFEALIFFFLRRTLDGLPVRTGLNALRAVFFNHEAAEPALWLAAARERLAAERQGWPAYPVNITAPPAARVQDLAFCIHTGRFRPPQSAGWVTGQIRREFDGRLRVDAQCGLDPALDARERAPQLAQHGPVLQAEVAQALRRVFGWQEALAA